MPEATAGQQGELVRKSRAELQQCKFDSDRPVVVEFKNVSKRYKLYKNERDRLLGRFFKGVPHTTISANNNLSFQIHKGQSVAFLGSNGAGKSTALKMITGVVYPTEGEIVVKGQVSALLELRAGFDGNLTGRDNIYLRGQIRGLSHEEIAELEPEVVEFAELGEFIDQPLRTYSSGMKARLGFAFASSINPDILVCDEALSVGDRRFARKCKQRVDSIMKRDDTTVIFVTHNTNSARNFCDYGIVMEKGTKVFEGLIEDAIAYYEGDD